MSTITLEQHEFALRLSEFGVAMFHRQGEKARVLAEVLNSMYAALSAPPAPAQQEEPAVNLPAKLEGDVYPTTRGDWTFGWDTNPAEPRGLRGIACAWSHAHDHEGGCDGGDAHPTPPTPQAEPSPAPAATPAPVEAVAAGSVQHQGDGLCTMTSEDGDAYGAIVLMLNLENDPPSAVVEAVRKLLAAPSTTPQEAPEGLTDAEILHIQDGWVGGPNPANLDNSDWIQFARAIESATLAKKAGQS